MPEHSSVHLQDKNWSLPIITDAWSALRYITDFSQIHITDFADILEENIPNVFIYRKADDKKYLSVSDIRRCIDDILLRPYDSTAVYVLIGFDEATREAQNAILKILEEPPIYARILLVVENPEWLLETIRSRCIILFQRASDEPLPHEIVMMIRAYFDRDTDMMVKYLYKAEYDTYTAKRIIMTAIPFVNYERMDAFESALIELEQVHENPRNILDKLFLSEFL